MAKHNIYKQLKLNVFLLMLLVTLTFRGDNFISPLLGRGPTYYLNASYSQSCRWYAIFMQVLIMKICLNLTKPFYFSVDLILRPVKALCDVTYGANYSSEDLKNMFSYSLAFLLPTVL